MSRFLLLGTGACEGIPAPFCRCELCSHARAVGGRDVRKRFSLLINDDTLVDFGPDAVQSFRMHGVNEVNIRRLLVTHSHVDHFSATDLCWRGGCKDKTPLSIFSGDEVRRIFDKMASRLETDPEQTGILWRRNEPGVEVSDGDWRILPVRASHCDAGECAFNYLVSAPDGHKLLILSDTGWWRPESWRAVEGVQADAAVIEMSFGIHDPYAYERGTHLGARSSLAFLEKLMAQNSLRRDAVCVAVHISHCSNTRHAQLEAWYSGTVLRPGWDGFQSEF